MTTGILDAHCHCGRQDLVPPQDYETLGALERQAGVQAAWMFPPVLEVYDRHDPAFVDTPDWQARRHRAHEYLLGLAAQPDQPRVFPFFFVWNDFDLPSLTSRFRGIKWHRHADEPIYHYDDPRCRRLLDAIIARRLPIVLEEEFANTMRFLDDLAPEAIVVIPHFDTPASCLAGLRALALPPADEALVLAGNALRLLSE